MVKVVPVPERKGNNWDYETELYALAKRLEYFNEETSNRLLRTALTHKSWVIGDPSEIFGLTKRLGSVEALEEPQQYNDRLTLLGSTVTSHYVMEWLYVHYPHLPADGLRCSGSSLALVLVVALFVYVV
jgi:dsRNA-specific ribonuclease